MYLSSMLSCPKFPHCGCSTTHKQKSQNCHFLGISWFWWIGGLNRASQPETHSSNYSTRAGIQSWTFPSHILYCFFAAFDRKVFLSFSVCDSSSTLLHSFSASPHCCPIMPCVNVGLGEINWEKISPLSILSFPRHHKLSSSNGQHNCCKIKLNMKKWLWEKN